MAEHIVADASPSATPQAADATSVPQGERVSIAVEAAWELEALAALLLRELKGAEPEDLRFRPFAMRVKQLARLQMSALGDEIAKPSDLWEGISGLRPGEEVAA